MRCKDFEQDIYLYSELSETEKTKVGVHLETCAACKELFQLVSATRVSITEAAAKKPEIVNHARLTSNIMQAVAGQRKQSTLWINNVFLKYTMAAVSCVLIIAFGAEQISSAERFSKPIPGTKTVTLNSASIIKTMLDKNQHPDSRSSLYACAKSGDCNNTFIETFKKKSL